MIINSLLAFSQKKTIMLYKKSSILRNIDWLIFANIILVILTSSVAQSDSIAIFAISTIILTTIKLLTKPKEKLSLTLGDFFLLIYFLLVLISVAGSSLFLLSLKGFFKVITYLGFYISFIHFLKDNRNKLKYILIILGLIAFGESIIALKQHFLSVSEISGWQDISRLNPEQIMTRVYGTLKPYNPNLFGGYMLAILPSTLILTLLPLINHHKKTALLGFTTLLIAMLTIFLTGCRGAYLGLFAELLLLVMLTYKLLKPIYKKIFIILTGLFCTISSFIIIATASLRARILSIFAMRNDSSNSFRFNVYNSCLEMFKDNWLLGIGVGNQNFREIYGLYMKTGFDALSAYNIYLEIALESGIFALIAFLAFVIFYIVKAFQYIRRKNNINTIYLSIAVLSIIGLMVHGLVDTVYFRPQINFVFWIMIGIIRVLTTTRRHYGYR